MKTKILFLTWDGAEENYMEGLFLPIFKTIQDNSDFEFHIIQFSWASLEKTSRINKVAKLASIEYTQLKIWRKYSVFLGSFYTLLCGIFLVKSYLKKNDIKILMPRSVFPAIISNIITNDKIRVIYDADGLSLEERIQDGSLSKTDLIFKLLNTQELKIVGNADAILVRSLFSFEYFKKRLNNLNFNKFFRVENGRNSTDFSFDQEMRISARKELELLPNEKLLIYVGSLGNKYALKEMLIIFNSLNEFESRYKFLILTPSIDYLTDVIDLNASKNLIVKSVKFSAVSKYLSAADFALCLIHQSLSMRAAAATKLGEYLMSGLPVVVTSSIGDCDEILEDKPFCLMLKNNSDDQLKRAVRWIRTYGDTTEREKIVIFGQSYFSLEKASASYLAALNSVG